VRERNAEVCVFARAKFPKEVGQLREKGVNVIHDECESAGAMIRAAMGVYQRANLAEEEIDDIAHPA
jgi:hypothetical protein